MKKCPLIAMGMFFGNPEVLSFTWHPGILGVEHSKTIAVFKVEVGVSNNSGTPKWRVCNGTPY